MLSDPPKRASSLHRNSSISLTAEPVDQLAQLTALRRAASNPSHTTRSAEGILSQTMQEERSTQRRLSFVERPNTTLPCAAEGASFRFLGGTVLIKLLRRSIFPLALAVCCFATPLQANDTVREAQSLLNRSRLHASALEIERLSAP